LASVQNCTLLGCTSAHAEYSANFARSSIRGVENAGDQEFTLGRCSSARFRQLSRSRKGTLTAFRRKSSTAYATAQRTIVLERTTRFAPPQLSGTVGQVVETRHAEVVLWISARHADDARGPDQCRSACVCSAKRRSGGVEELFSTPGLSQSVRGAGRLRQFEAVKTSPRGL
jgi:hypothetical protein